MGIPPELPPIDLTDGTRLPIGTLLLNDVDEKFYIVVGYWLHGSYRNKKGECGYKEIHTLYKQEDQREYNYDLSPNLETGYTEWKVIK